MANITLYTKDRCAYCLNAKRLLTARDIEFDEVDITADPSLELELISQTRQRTVPQIFVENTFVGGFTELVRLNSAGKLDHLKRAA